MVVRGDAGGGERGWWEVVVVRCGGEKQGLVVLRGGGEGWWWEVVVRGAGRRRW